jgi:hypothetical protein
MTEIDYKKRCERYEARLEIWAAQADWERLYGTHLVNWSVAFLNLLAHPDSDEDGVKLRDDLLSRALALLVESQQVLEWPDRLKQRKTRARIAVQLRQCFGHQGHTA